MGRFFWILSIGLWVQCNHMGLHKLEREEGRAGRVM